MGRDSTDCARSDRCRKRDRVTGQTSARTLRTRSYTGGIEPTVAAGVATGSETAATETGQVLVLSAVNMLARVHPAIVLSFPDTPLIVRSPCGGSTLAEACAKLAAAANPEIIVDAPTRTANTALCIGIGADATHASVYAGGARFTGFTGTTPQTLTPEPSTLMGGALAVTLAAGYLFRTAIALPVIIDRSISLWTLDETTTATGPAACGPVEVGNAWIVGAGAIGSALAWWLYHTGLVGAWTIIDGDCVEATNLNRSLGLFAHDAGLTGLPAVMKAEAAASLIPRSQAFPIWWDDWVATDPASPDVLLPLANERAVRAAIAAYSHPAVLHASTSPNWTAELHRHLIGRDDCIACRLPEAAPAFACATAPALPTGDGRGTSNDAALPFLSGAAGLLALAGLLQLQHSQWPAHSRNHWRVFFDHSPAGLSRARWPCMPTCTATSADRIRHKLHGTTRWHHLDPNMRRATAQRITRAG
jgi:hypothetical protein